MPEENASEAELVGKASQQLGNAIDRCGQDRCTGSSGDRVNFLIVAGSVLRFGFVTRTTMETA